MKTRITNEWVINGAKCDRVVVRFERFFFLFIMCRHIVDFFLFILFTRLSRAEYINGITEARNFTRVSTFVSRRTLKTSPCDRANCSVCISNTIINRYYFFFAPRAHLYGQLHVFENRSFPNLSNSLNRPQEDFPDFQIHNVEKLGRNINTCATSRRRISSRVVFHIVETSCSYTGGEEIYPESYYFCFFPFLPPLGLPLFTRHTLKS